MPFPSADRPGTRRADIVTLVVLVLAGGALSLLPRESELFVARHVRSTVLRPFLWTHDYLESRGDLAVRLERAVASRDTLARLVAALRDVRLENVELREAAGLADRTRGAFVSGEVTPSTSRAGGAGTFVLDLREPGSLRAPAGVLTGRGVVGVIRTVDGSVAHGEFWTHSNFRVSVRTVGGDASGIVLSDAREGQPAMLLRGAPFQAEIPTGTTVVTSGLGGLYPAGIPVGIVREVARVESGWQKSYLLEPSVRPEQVRTVMVWRRGGEAP